jgi:hypothetical protein
MIHLRVNTPISVQNLSAYIAHQLFHLVPAEDRSDAGLRRFPPWKALRSRCVPDARQFDLPDALVFLGISDANESPLFQQPKISSQRRPLQTGVGRQGRDG